MSKKMNSIRKSMVIGTFLLSVTLLINVGLYVSVLLKKHRIASFNDFIKRPESIIAITIVLLAIGSFLFVFFIGKKRKKGTEYLNEEYDLVYEQVNQYIGLSGLTFFEKRELNNELLNLFLEAQSNNKSVDQVIGKDVKTFIENMIQAYGANDHYLNDILIGVTFFVFYLIAFQSYLYLKFTYIKNIKENISYFDIKLDYTLILLAVLFSFVIMPVIYRSKRLILVQQPKESSSYGKHQLILILYPLGIGLFFIGILEGLRRFFGNVSWVAIFINDGIVVIGSPIILILLIIVAVMAYITRKKFRKFFL